MYFVFCLNELKVEVGSLFILAEDEILKAVVGIMQSTHWFSSFLFLI